MPNATARATRKRGKAQDKNEENTEVTNATSADIADAAAEAEDEVTFDLFSEPAPEDYEPNRKSPGRTRKPSYFDDVLRREDVFGGSWQRVPFTSEDHKAYILRELNRAKLHLNVGLELDTDKEDAVYYKSREVQKRPRKVKAEDGTETEVEVSENEDGYNEDDE